MKKYYVYILRSKKTNKFYIGQTNNLGKRLVQHKDEKTSFGKRNKDIALVYKIEALSLSEARKLENFVKRQKSHTFIEKLIQCKYTIPR